MQGHACPQDMSQHFSPPRRRAHSLPSFGCPLHCPLNWGKSLRQQSGLCKACWDPAAKAAFWEECLPLKNMVVAICLNCTFPRYFLDSENLMQSSSSEVLWWDFCTYTQAHPDSHAGQVCGINSPNSAYPGHY